MSLLTVGSVAFDQIETPFGSTDRIVGGAGTYIAYSASNFLQEQYLVSVVGGDFPQPTLEDLKSRGVDLDGVEMKENEKTFFWRGKYHQDLNHRDTLATELNVLETFQPVVPESAKDMDYVMLGNLHPAVQRSVIEQMNSRPKLIVMDTMNFWMDIAMEDLKKTIAMVDLLTINDEEARQLSGEYSLRKAAQVILQMGPKYLIIKKGEHGALLFHQGGMFFCPALPLEEVKDPTGAGDTFAGAFIAFLASRDELSFEAMKQAVVYGSALASFCVEEFGTDRLRNLDRQEIHDRYQEFVQLARIPELVTA